MRLLVPALLFTSAIGFAETVRFTDQPYHEIREVLRLELDAPDGLKVSGLYTTTDDGTLNGPFRVNYHDRGHSDELETDYEFLLQIVGYFTDTARAGEWRYAYIYNDGVDLYEKFEVTIQYGGTPCLASAFDGQIGHIMPETKHEFRDAELCTVGAILEKVWNTWNAEYEARKRAREL